MPRYFTHYWTNDTWENAHRSSAPDAPLEHTAGNRFVERGVGPGDFVYVVTIIKGELYLLGRLRVGKVCDTNEAIRTLGTRDLWKASDHVVASESTPKDFNLVVPLEVTKRLVFISDIAKSLKFRSPGHLDGQTLRGVRELEPESAAELNRLLPSV